MSNMEWIARNSVNLALAPIGVAVLCAILVYVLPSDGHASVGYGWGVTGAGIILSIISLVVSSITSLLYLIKSRNNQNTEYLARCKYALYIVLVYFVMAFLWLAR